MFRLAYLTPREWVARVAGDPLALLVDHAHCELKAASSAQAVCIKHGDKRELVESLAGVAVEEVAHFEAVVRELHARGGQLTSTPVNPYAEELYRRSARTREDLLLDRLVVSGLIEARSLERFHLLAAHLSDAPLAQLYKGLLPSEASHQGLFFRFARELFGDRGKARVEELRGVEGEVMATQTFGYRVHSGLAPELAGARV